jgi:hypothetical protein
MWVVLSIQIILSIATLVGVATTVAWVRATSREGQETRRLLQTLSDLVHSLQRPAPPAAEHIHHPGAVDIGGEVVQLDEETIARLDAVTEKASARGGMNALYSALQQGLNMAERGLDEGEQKPGAEETPGRVVPLRPRGKPPGDGEAA